MITGPPVHLMRDPEPTQTESHKAGRPAVSVIVPFAGTPSDAEATIAQLARLELRPGDELTVVDNQPGGAVSPPAGAVARVLRDASQASSYYARNRGAEEARNEWLLFLDSDCRPAPALLDLYFAEPPADECGVVAGGVVSAPEQTSTIASWARSREQVSEEPHAHGEVPAGVTANLLVRRAAWDAAGGFHEGVRSGADVEFCWRVQELGWTFERRTSAVLEHLHPDRLRVARGKAARYGAGRTWVNRRYPGRTPRQPLIRPLARCAAGAVVWTVALRPRRALHKLIDAAWFVAMARGGWAGDNRAPGVAVRDGETLVTGEFPGLGAEIADGLGCVEARARPRVPDRLLARRVAVSYREDDPPRERVRASLRLALLKPRRALRYARWRGVRGERGFAAAAPAALRLRGRAQPPSLDGSFGSEAEDLVRLAGLD